MIAQLVKNLPAMQETMVRFLGQENPLEKGQATHSSILELPLVAQLVKNPPAMRETSVQSLGWEDHLEKGMATTSVFWPREFHGLYSLWGHKESDTTEQLLPYFTSVKFKTHFMCLVAKF